MKTTLPTVEECIKYIETTDYKLTRRGRVLSGRKGSALYIFESQTRPQEFREMVFSVSELRDAFHNGF